MERKAIHHPAQCEATERPHGATREMFVDFADGHRAAALERAQSHRPAGFDAAGGRAARGESEHQRPLAAVGVHDVASRRVGSQEVRSRRDPGAELTGWRQPGGAVERDVLGGDPGLQCAHARVQEAEGLDDVAHGLVEVRLLPLGTGRICARCAAHP